MKPQFESYIFEPNEEKEILEERLDLIGWIVLGLMIFFVIIEWFWMAILALFTILLSAFIITITRWGTQEPLNGNFTKSLVINQDSITVGEDNYPISELKIRRITTDDYHGLKTIRHQFFSRYPQKSNGTGNHLWFVHKQHSFKYRFRIRGKSQVAILEDIKKNFRIKW